MAKTQNLMHDQPTFRLLCKVVREVATQEPIERGPDLWEAIKVQLAHRHLRWTPDQLTRAIEAVEHAMQCQLWQYPATRPQRVGPPSAPPSRTEAKQLLQAIAPGFGQNDSVGFHALRRCGLPPGAAASKE